MIEEAYPIWAIMNKEKREIVTIDGEKAISNDQTWIRIMYELLNLKDERTGRYKLLMKYAEYDTESKTWKRPSFA